MGMYDSVADLLEYPDERLSERLETCVAALHPGSFEVRSLADFRRHVDRMGVQRLQELYTAAFDMDAGCALYAGHHLFGEDVRRSIFMACLAAQYREADIDVGPDLPDYLPTILRYVARARDEAAGIRQELVEDVLRPAARKLAEALEGRQHPYAPVMRALAQLLES